MPTVPAAGRHDLANCEWSVLEPLLPAGKKAGRPPKWARRQLIDGIRWRIRAGAPWRDVPPCYGPWQSVYGLFRCWQRDGTWRKILAALQALADAAGHVTWDVSVATVGANLAHGIGHGPVGALVSAWPALALVGSFELLMMLIRTGRGTRVGDTGPGSRYQAAPPLAQEAPLELPAAPTLEHTVRARHRAGRSQRAIARELNLDRRKVKRILDQAV